MLISHLTHTKKLEEVFIEIEHDEENDSNPIGQNDRILLTKESKFRNSGIGVLENRMPKKYKYIFLKSYCH